MRIITWCLTVFLALPGVANAISTDTQYWSALTLRKGLAETPWSVGFEGVYRYSDKEAEAVVKSGRLWGFYKLENGTELGLGYEDRTANSDTSDERRVLVQGVHRWKFEHVSLQARLRQEQRYFYHLSEVWQHRTRLMVRADATALKFWKATPYVAPEFFWINNTISSSRRAGPAEFRGTMGLSISAAENLKVDVGYINRRTFNSGRNGGATKESLYHVANLSVSYTFD